MEIGLPEEAGRDRTPGLPRLADLPQRRLARALGETHAFLEPELQPEVAGGPDIGPPEREDQVDLGAPPSDALEANEGGEGIGIGGGGERGEIELAAGDSRGQPAGIIRL